MRWQRGPRSANLEDRRFETGRRGGRRGGVQLGCGGILVLLVLSIIFKQDFFSLLDATGGGMATTSTAPGTADPAATTAEEEELVDFVSFVLDDAQGVWQQQLSGYRDAKLVLFRDAVQSACGFAQAATGPFYCPADQKVYVDLGFYDELRDRFGAPGDFAQAYVLAHEIGHHVQNLLGTERELRQAQRQRPDLANQLLVRLELQADCYAGVWAHSARGDLDPGDVKEGLDAAAAVGDDRIQRMSGRAVNPESFTHGSSTQRVEWFQRGFKSGDPEDCDTFQ